jgi:putative oxidoreductase
MEPSMTPRAVFEWILRIGLGAVFIYAGGAKVPDIGAFFWDIHHFDLTPVRVSEVMAFLLPWLEIFAGLALIVGRLYFGAIAICGLLSLIFFVAISSAWYRGLDITCGCFGREDNQTNFPKHIAINVAMLLASIALWWLAARRASRHVADRADAGRRAGETGPP